MLQLPTWIDRPDASALLARCAKNPPTLEYFTQSFGLTSDRWSRFAGRRADQLEAIRERHLSELSGADWNASNPDAAACKRFMALSAEQPSVAEAIEAAIGATRTIKCRDYDMSVGGSLARVA